MIHKARSLISDEQNWDLSIRDLHGKTVSRTHSKKQHYRIIPLPSIDGVDNFVSALQFAYTYFNPDPKYNISRTSYDQIIERLDGFRTPNSVADAIKELPHLRRPFILLTCRECLLSGLL